ncbi:hypothetical protein M0R45_002249 [Rubus argutus]|uniref:Uncharacterized protein n=1 Tax=Rubus argutus TaxID=59490 RepID=A0AAW1VGU0_RUBAR
MPNQSQFNRDSPHRRNLSLTCVDTVEPLLDSSCHELLCTAAVSLNSRAIPRLLAANPSACAPALFPSIPALHPCTSRTAQTHLARAKPRFPHMPTPQQPKSLAQSQPPDRGPLAAAHTALLSKVIHRRRCPTTQTTTPTTSGVSAQLTTAPPQASPCL